MSEPFYVPGENRAEKVKQLFTTIARRYDLINDLQSFGLHRHWKKKTIQLAQPRTGVSALDVCCGTGDLARGLARRGAQTIGLDFNRPMLEIAERKAGIKDRATPAGFGELKFIEGDAQQLPFPDNTFDIVTVGYGLRNLADWERGLSEMCRVAKAGGRIIVLDFGKPGNSLWRSLYFGYLRLFVPWLGRIVCGNADAYAYILASLKDYSAQQGVRTKMCHLGLEQLQVINLLGGAMSINYGEKRR